MINRLRKILDDVLAKRVVFVTSRRVDLLDNETDVAALVAVVGREHYESLHRKYPVRAWGDLARVLRLEFPPAFPGERLFAIGPLVGDEREVEIFRLSQGSPRDRLRALFWVPESFALRSLARSDGVVVVQRDGLEYFLAANGLSTMAGGLIRSPELFALAVGAADTRVAAEPVQLPRLLASITTAIKDFSVLDWWGFRSPIAADYLGGFIKPASVFAAGAIALYLAAVSTFLWGMESYRSRQLEQLGPEVTTLLAKQRALDLMSAERAGVAELLDSTGSAWPLWEVASTVWRARGIIHSFMLVDDRVTIRCTAPEATEVMTALRALKGVRDVEFESAVRQGMGGQDFSVSFVREPPGKARS